jgi:Carboxypeptidase regulatory-like domain
MRLLRQTPAPRLGDASSLSLSVLLYALAPDVALATSCMPTPLNVVARQSDAIIEATVVSVSPVPVSPSPDGSFVAGSNLVRVELTDVTALKGSPASAVLSGHDWVKPGYRYIFATQKRSDGASMAYTCGGLVRTAARADGFRAWLASLAAPSAGGRIFGAVTVRPWGTQDLSDWPAVAAVRVVVRGPVTREAVTTESGEFSISELPSGDYDVELRAGEGRSDVALPKPMRVNLSGDHAAANLDFFADVNGTIEGSVVDESGKPVPNLQLRVHAGPTADAAARDAFGILTTDADGRYRGTSLAPGRYLITILDPYLTAHAPAPTGGHEIVAGWADHISMQPFVVHRGELVDVQLIVSDRNGNPLDDEVSVELLGAYGPIPMTGRDVETSRSGAFPKKLVRGNRYRFTLTRPAGQAPVSADHLIDGSTIRIVAPQE